MKWCFMEDSRNETQKLADLLDCKLLFDDEKMKDLDFFCITERSKTAALADLLD